MSCYLSHAIKSCERLLSLMDRTRLSPTYGCFDRDYWHFKTSDFPNAARQQGLLSLAQLYLFNSKSNPHHQSDYILELINGAISYSAAIQKNDGSFDEWYYNERGWAGPTGYLVHTFAKTFYLLEEVLAEDSKLKLTQLICRGADHLCKSDERHPLSNHIAMAMLPLYEAFVITGHDRYQAKYLALKERLLNLFNKDEGWGIEYDGADPGYQTATVSFLAQIHALSNESWIEEFTKKSFKFISYFAYPDGSFGGSVGARHTSNIFYSGVEYWSDRIPLAATLSQWIEKTFINGNHTLPLGHDDNYLVYRIPELMDACSLSLSRNRITDTPPLPYERDDIDLHFSSSGSRIVSNLSYYFVSNLKRGGAYKVFNKSTMNAVDNDCGILLQKGKQLYSSLWCQECDHHNRNETHGTLVRVTPKYFTIITSLLFRLTFLIFANHSGIASTLKNLIRSSLIVFKGKGKLNYIRKFSFGESSISVVTAITSTKLVRANISIGGEFSSRYVPQSRYFCPSDTLASFNRDNHRFKSISLIKKINTDDDLVEIQEETVC